MQTINTILGLGGNLAFTIAAFLFVLTIVVFFHELGHFLAARWCGVKVQAFSIGFGREIFGFHDKHGTRWRFAWIPLGGYVKFMDDENAASVPSQDAMRNDDGRRAGRQFSHQAIVAEGFRRRRRPARQLSSWRSSFSPACSPLSANVSRRRSGRRDRGRQRRRGSGLQGRRPHSVDRRHADRDVRRHAAHRRHQRRSEVADHRRPARSDESR